MDIDETPYAHERLTPGALHEPNSVHLHFDLGTDVDARRKLLELLLRFGATPKETLVLNAADKTGYTVSLPIHVPDQLANYGLLGMRLLDELDVEPCTVQLKHVILHSNGDGVVGTTNPADMSTWQEVRTGYVASCPGTIQAHHIVTIPKRGPAPPQELSEKMPQWSLFAEAGAWHFRSTKVIRLSELPETIRRDAARLKSLFKNAGKELQISIVVEQVLATWNYPLQLSGDNRHRTSLKHWAGVSDRRLPDFAGLCAKTRDKPAQKLLVHDEATRSQIVANIEPFRRIAIAQGLDPLVIGIGLIPVHNNGKGPQFGEYFCTQAAAYGSTEQEAEAILEAYGSLIWFLVHSGYSPIMSHPDLYDQVLFWSSVLPQSKSKSTKPRKRPNGIMIAAGEQVLSVEPMRQLKRLEDAVIESLSRTLGRSREFHLENAGLLGVPFRTTGDGEDGHLGGCLFALLTGPKLERDQLEQLAIRESIFLHRIPFKAAEPRKQPTLANVKSNLRIGRVKEHDKLWTALEQVWHEPAGKRLAKLQSKHHELLNKYSLLEGMKEDIENSHKLTALMESIWIKMTGLTSRSSLYDYRQKAGLPSRKRR